MQVLRLLVGGWLLCRSASLEAKENVLRELAVVPGPVSLPAELSLNNAKQIGITIITHLAQQERIRLRPILYRTESQRLALDRVLALCRKEA